MRFISIVIFVFLLSLFACNKLLLIGWDARDYSLVKSIVKPINDARVKGRMCGNKYYEAVQPVVWNKKLGQASLHHSLDMAKNGFMSHKGSDGSNPKERLAQAGYQWIACGENIGHGYRTPEEAVRSWLKSKRHCKNIMNPEFKEVGASYAKSTSLRTYWTLVFGTPER